MEEVLDLYEQPYDPLLPMVRFDERPCQLIGEVKDCSQVLNEVVLEVLFSEVETEAIVCPNGRAVEPIIT